MLREGAGVSTGLITYPADDATFRQLAESLVAAGSTTPDELETRLRVKHPAAHVVQGIVDANIARWYVFRDGRLIGGSSSP